MDGSPITISFDFQMNTNASSGFRVDSYVYANGGVDDNSWNTALYSNVVLNGGTNNIPYRVVVHLTAAQTVGFKNGIRLYFRFWQMSGGTVSSLYFSSAQLEKGSVVSDYEFRPIPIETLLAQHYWRKLSPSGRFGATASSVPFGYSIPLVPPMRTAPTCTLNSTTRVNSSTSTVYNVTSDNIIWYMQASASGAASSDDVWYLSCES